MGVLSHWRAIALLVGLGCLNHALYAASDHGFDFGIAAPADEDHLERVDPGDTDGGKMERAFRERNPGYRIHEFNRVTDVYEDNQANPGLRLDWVWSGSDSTLVRLTGLERKGRRYSAVLNKQNLRLMQGPRVSGLIGYTGATEMRDKRGGAALLVSAGDRVYLEFEAINDLYPFSLEHTLPNQKTFAYFVDLDPRFEERYRRHYAEADTPEKRYQFLMNYAGKDTDKRVPEVFMRLMQDLRDLNTFDGYYQAYLVAQDPKDARMAQRLATTEAHKAKLENLAVATLADKGRLFDFDLKPSVGRVKESEGSCWFACRYNFWATRDVFATLTVRQRRDSPIKLKHGRYRVTFVGELNLPQWQIRESDWHGDYDGPDKDNEKFTQQVIFEPGQTSAEQEFKVGNITLATFERGSAGGYHGIWATADPTITLSIKSVELIP